MPGPGLKPLLRQNPVFLKAVDFAPARASDIDFHLATQSGDIGGCLTRDVVWHKLLIILGVWMGSQAQILPGALDLLILKAETAEL